MGLLRQLSQEPKLKEKTWKELTLEEKVEVIKAQLKEANYSAKDAILGLVLQNGEDRREFKVELRDLKHLPPVKKEMIKEEPKLKEKVWKELPLEEKVAVVKALLKEANYSAPDAILGLVLQGEEERREFKVEIKDLKHIKAAKKEEIKEEPKLRQNLALAHQIEELLDTGKINDVKQLTGHLNMSHVRINQIMGMALLAPKIQEDILLSGDKAIFQVPEYKINELVREADWDKQTKSWQALLLEYSDQSPKVEIPSPLLA